MSGDGSRPGGGDGDRGGDGGGGGDGGRGRPARVFVLDSEALSLAVGGDRMMIARLRLAADGEAEVVTSPTALVAAHDGRTTEQRWEWVLSRIGVADIGRDQVRDARRLLADAGLHGRAYAIDAVLAAVAHQQKGQVTVFTTTEGDGTEGDGKDPRGGTGTGGGDRAGDPYGVERLVPDRIVVRKV
ncbi:hypothetical protein ABT354_33150 [Streptomyces sp. NPDC000594]|uniref:hypothetical protein n=1 Tax=Streptomyces sp. NPDC000594 TaxID=3154261 RepID=UPI0033187388